MSDNRSTVRLRTELTDLIDKLVDEEKDELGLPRFKSRADFVTQACKQYLNHLLEMEPNA